MPNENKTDDGPTIRDLFLEAGHQLRAEFEEIKQNNPHYAERGAEAEDVLKQFLNDHLPQRFQAESGLVIDNANEISRQCDVLIYDALNSPTYRRGTGVRILPSDNVASVVEVKTRLNKRQLADAAEKVGSVKRLMKTPEDNLDQPVLHSPLVTTRTLGVVLAFESDTTLETLAENLAEINAERPTVEWIDLVVVLDVDCIGYTVQFPFSQEIQGWFAGACSENFMVPPYYIHLVKDDLGELTLNWFFQKLMTHLMIYRRRSTMTENALMGRLDQQLMTICAYQYNLSRQLEEADDYHTSEKFHGPTGVFNLFTKRENKWVGQVGWIPWKDGAVISYSGIVPPERMLHVFPDSGIENLIIQPGATDAPIWLSSVVDLKESVFDRIARKINGDFVARKEGEPGGDPPIRGLGGTAQAQPSIVAPSPAARKGPPKTRRGKGKGKRKKGRRRR